jgi:hypothetical protein
MWTTHAQEINQFPCDFVHPGRWKVDLVDHRDDLQPALDCQVDVAHRLRLDALCRVDDQNGPFARREAARDLVCEIDVPRRIDQVEKVLALIHRPVQHPDRVALDRDSPFALEVHGVQNLRAHLAAGQRVSDLQKTVGQRRLAVVDVRDDAEVSYAL